MITIIIFKAVLWALIFTMWEKWVVILHLFVFQLIFIRVSTLCYKQHFGLSKLMFCQSEEGVFQWAALWSAHLSNPWPPWSTSTPPSRRAAVSFCICSELLFQPRFYLKEFRGKSVVWVHIRLLQVQASEGAFINEKINRSSAVKRPPSASSRDGGGVLRQ